MSDPASLALICRWRDRFEATPLARTIVVGLRTQADEIWRHAFDLLRRESPEYRNAVDDVFAEESKAHCNTLLLRIVGIAAGDLKKSSRDPFDFVRAHARWRARRQVPLVASLHAYRIAHRTYSDISQDALGRHAAPGDIVCAQRMLNEFWIEFFDHVGRVLADTHAAEDALVVAHETHGHARLMDSLLRGTEPTERELRRLCAARGIRSGAPLAVAIARPLLVNGGHVDREITFRTLAHRLEDELPPTVLGSLIDVKASHVTAIVCGDGTVAHSLFQALRRGRFAKRAANGQSVAVGISMDVVNVAGLPQALEEALIAIEFASAGQPVIRFSDVDLPDLLVRRADQFAVRLIPDWAKRLHSSEDSQARELIRTIRLFANCDFNVKSTARKLDVHTNTVYFRLNRLKALSSADPRTYTGASTILTALRLLELHNGVGSR